MLKLRKLSYLIVSLLSQFEVGTSLQMKIMIPLSFEKFKIKVENPDLFCQSQWDRPGKLDKTGR